MPRAAGFPHEFADAELMAQAFASGTAEFERLEWLGDRVLGCSVALLLERNHPERTLEELHNAFCNVVSNDSLQRLGAELELDKAPLAGSGRHNLANISEALLGAVVLEGGFDAVFACVEKLFGERLGDSARLQWRRDPKSILKELCEAKRKPEPSYEFADSPEGFVTTCQALGVTTTGTGRSKLEAQKVAAQAVIDQLDAGDPAPASG